MIQQRLRRHGVITSSGAWGGVLLLAACVCLPGAHCGLATAGEKTTASAGSTTGAAQKTGKAAAPAGGTGRRPAKKAEGRPATAGPKVQRLFDGKSLKGWKVTEFGGEGPVTVQRGRLVLGAGATLTGVTWTGPLPKTNYEVQLEAMRVDGADFFCGMTFPVGNESCSLIVGGWGGTIVGLSSIDNMDASENETTRFRSFENGRWYKIRLRVTDKKIEAWIDKDRVMDLPRADRSFSVRIEVELSRPFGFASWQTTAALRHITLRRLDGK